jgi:hypothetical protein
MRLSEIQKKARDLGIKDANKQSKTDLIKTIQRKEGNFDCFGTAVVFCDRAACCWRLDCVK